MKQLLCKLAGLGVAMVLLISNLCAVNASNDEQGYLTYLYAQGVVDDEFGTDVRDQSEPLLREEFFALLSSCLYGKQPQATSLSAYADFKSVSAPLSGYIKKAHEEGIVMGEAGSDEKRYIRPGEVISKQDAVAAVGRALGLGVNTPAGYTDVDSIDPKAADYVAGCEKAALIDSGGAFKPNSEMTWGQGAQLVARAMQGGFVKPAKVTSIAGSGSKGAAGGKAKLAGFNEPSGIMVEGDAIYIADAGNNLIRLIQDAEVSTSAGQVAGYDDYDSALNALYDSTAKNALFARPTGLLSVPDGILVLDSANHVIRSISGGNVKTFAGTGRAGKIDGLKSVARFSSPQGLCADDEGNIYVADAGNNAIRKINPSAEVSTVAKVNAPFGVAWHDGTLYVTNTRSHKVMKVKDGEVSTFAGSLTGMTDTSGNPVGDYRDGAAKKAYFYNPTGICVGDDGTVYVADTANGLVRKIKDGIVGTVAGFGNGASFVSPRGLFIEGNQLYVTDSSKHTIVKIEVGAK